jgi:two-component system NtrC family response regulator
VALNVLAVLQDPETRDQVLELLAEQGHEAQVRSVPESGFRVVSESALDLLVLEYRGEGRAIELIQRVKDECPRCQVIIITDQVSMSQREIPPQLGVRNIIYRPVNLDVLRRLVQFADRASRPDYTPRPSPVTDETVEQFSRMVGNSPAFRSAVKVAEQAAKSHDTPVLVIGEAGSGRGLVARAIHEQSARRNGAFVQVMCGAIPGELMESEVFGHEAGAFTEATGRKLGLIELAGGGTIYFDGVNELDLPLQAKLLRFMDSGRLRRVMSEIDVEADVRIIASTTRDLSRDVAIRSFRTDLYNRISGVQVMMPPLRERGADVVDLARVFLQRSARRLNKPVMSMSTEAERLLLEYNWPGNVRELHDVIERAVLNKSGGELRPEDFPIEASRRPLYLVESGQDAFHVRLPDGGIGLEEIERRVIETALERCRGNVMEAARFLRIGRGALRYRIVKHGLEDDRSGSKFRKAS